MAPLHYRLTEGEKTEALKQKAGNVDAHMCLTKCAKSELQWWVDTINKAENHIYKQEPEITVSTDASLRAQ